MLLRGESVSFVAQHLECLDQLDPGFARLDDIVDEPELCCNIRISERVFIVFNEVLSTIVRIPQRPQSLADESH